MSTKLTYTGAEVQELLDKIGKGDFDNAKTLEGHPASYFAVASELTSLAESFATEQGRINTLYSYFNNGSANDALRLGGQLPSYYATALQYEILQQTLTDFKSLFDSMFEKDSEGNIHAKLSLWSSGGITAGGVGSGGSGGGGDISYNRLDSWADYSADKSGWVLSALLGKDLDSRVSALANAGYVTASALAPYALRSELPIITKDGLKSTLGISDWALASAKPTYTASEVGALAVSEEVNSGSLNDYTTAGIYRFNVIGNAIAGMNNHGNLLVVRGGNYDTFAQLYFNYNDGKVFIRSSNFQLLPYANWNQIAFTSDIPTKLSQLTNDKINNRLTIDSLGDYTGLHIANYKELCGIRFSNSNTSDSGNLIYLGGTDYRVTNDGWTATYKLLHEGNYSNLLAGGTVNGSLTANSFIGNLVGTADNSKGLGGYTWETKQNSIDTWVPVFNVDKIQYRVIPADYNNAPSTLTVKHAGTADSTTKLATPRTIWGQSFDGTQDITGALTAPSITANSLTIGGATITYDSVNEALCINGNMYALGGITAGGAGISTYSSLEARVARLEQQLNI